MTTMVAPAPAVDPASPGDDPAFASGASVMRSAMAATRSTSFRHMQNGLDPPSTPKKGGESFGCENVEEEEDSELDEMCASTDDESVYSRISQALKAAESSRDVGSDKPIKEEGIMPDGMDEVQMDRRTTGDKEAEQARERAMAMLRRVEVAQASVGGRPVTHYGQTAEEEDPALAAIVSPVTSDDTAEEEGGDGRFAEDADAASLDSGGESLESSSSRRSAASRSSSRSLFRSSQKGSSRQLKRGEKGYNRVGPADPVRLSAVSIRSSLSVSNRSSLTSNGEGHLDTSGRSSPVDAGDQGYPVIGENEGRGGIRGAGSDGYRPMDSDDTPKAGVGARQKVDRSVILSAAKSNALQGLVLDDSTPRRVGGGTASSSRPRYDPSWTAAADDPATKYLFDSATVLAHDEAGTNKIRRESSRRLRRERSERGTASSSGGGSCHHHQRSPSVEDLLELAKRRASAASGQMAAVEDALERHFADEDEDFDPEEQGGGHDKHQRRFSSVPCSALDAADGNNSLDDTTRGTHHHSLPLPDGHVRGRTGARGRLLRTPRERLASYWSAILFGSHGDEDDEQGNGGRRGGFCGSKVCLVLSAAILTAGILTRALIVPLTRDNTPSGSQDLAGGQPYDHTIPEKGQGHHSSNDDDTRSPPPPRPAAPPAPAPIPEYEHTPGRFPPALENAQLTSILEGITLKATLQDSSSPQYHAWQWLIDDVQTSRVYESAGGREHRAAQRYVLAVLYYSTGGASSLAGVRALTDGGSGWVQNDKWLGPANECGWGGLRCRHEDGTVPQDGEPASGNLPPPDVTFVDLSENGLVGKLPEEIWWLKHLEHLHLYDNKLSGNLPDAMSNLVHLQTMYLDNNQLNGRIPISIDKMAALEHLHMQSNKFSGPIPNSIGLLSNLVDLRLSSNDLTGEFPVEFIELSKLSTLLLDDNSIEGTLPREFSLLTSLTSLRLQKNSLFGSIPDLSELKKLEQLHLDDNAFSGSLPARVGPASLRELILSRNSLTGVVPVAIGNLKNIEDLRLSNADHNGFSGSIPSQLGLLPLLQRLHLNHNSLSGTVPDELGQARMLEELMLEGNELTGGMPGAVCDRGLSSLTADCAGDSPEVKCSCCTKCF